ncbi:penicillin acylase family protein [Photobacterium sp. GSS17]|uniref:penicillin acylase family protein n=1 Tax=Photobacterium sp. GSS17 TaxID=3020715 RepID=UPI00235E58C4|nr:penicillin acylase family protein [Photobacterium sp. GSS17]
MKKHTLSPCLALVSLSLLTACSSLPMPEASLAETRQAAQEDITILRDNYGTPHIYADNTYGLFYGFGYAIAQDRLYQLETAKRSAQGKVAEVLGKEYLPLDIKVREHYNPDAIRQALNALPPEDAEIFQGYADGLNAWIRHIEQSPDTLMPKQFLDGHFAPTQWQPFDVVMVFVGSMINRFGDYNTELENQQLLQALQQQHGKTKGRALFDALLPYQSQQAVDTIPDGEWTAQARQKIRNERVAALRQTNSEGAVIAKTSAAPTTQALFTDETTLAARTGLEGTLGWRGFKEAPFSNILVLGKAKTAGANAVLINGPQFGFYRPAYTYSVGLHGAGYDVVGNSPAGYPLVQFGHNQHISWGSTWGAGDNVDLFRLTLNPDNPEEYLYKGRYIAFDKQHQTVKVKGEADRTITVYRSVHGPVINYDPQNQIAFAKQRGWAGKELSTLLAWNKVAQASNHQEWQQQVAQSAINVNWYYADQQGNIAYALGGHYPVRHPGVDGRLPTNGDGSADWLGLYPFSTNPQVLNPGSGYIANWNNRPAKGFPNPDQWWYSWNTVDRNLEITRRVDAASLLTAQDAWQLMMDASLSDPNARHFVPQLVTLARHSQDPTLQQAAEVLASWDYRNTDDNGDGRYDHPASTLFRTWLSEALTLTYTPLLPDPQRGWFTNPGYGNKERVLTNSYNIQTGTKALAAIWSNPTYLTTQEADSLKLNALRTAIDHVTARYGTNSNSWHNEVDVLRFSHKNYIGVPQAGQDEVTDTPIALNRGTENNMTVFGRDKIEAFEVAAPGQSGFISPNGERSAHYNDQYEDFVQFRLKPVYSSREALEQTSPDKTVLTVSLPDPQRI